MKPMPSPLSTRHRGFTLTELLVAFVVMVTLAVVSLSVFKTIRNSAGSAVTVSNLRQIQAANVTFASDNGGFYVGNDPTEQGNPYGYPWFSYDPFASMVGTSFTSASDPWGRDYPEAFKCGIKVAVAGPPRHDRNFTIAMNQSGWSHQSDGSSFPPDVVRGHWTPGKLHSSLVRNPSEFITFFESCHFWSSMWLRLDWKDDAGGFNPGMAFRNKGGRCNVVFADGHVGSFTRDDMKSETSRVKRNFLFNAD